MAKLLGQDIVTQVEFDAFKADVFDPLAGKIEESNTAVKGHQRLILTAIALSTFSLVGVIGLGVFLMVH